jgi:hypothetical protein
VSKRRDIARNHAQECGDCAGQEEALARVDAILGAYEVDFDPSRASDRLQVAARRRLAVYARRAYVRRVMVSLLLASAPLPAAVALGYYTYGAAYDALSAVLPGAIAGWYVGAHVAVAVLLWAVAYAAIPLLVHRHATAEGAS